MNKVIKIHPISVLRIVWLSIWIFVISSTIAAIVVILIERNLDPYTIIGLLIAFVILIVSLVFFIGDFKRGIRFDSEGIEVSEDFSGKNGLIVKKFQHALHLKYEDIIGICIDFSKNDTHNKKVPDVFIDMPNIVLLLKNGGEERINVYFYSLKQKIRIIDILKYRVEKTGNYLDLSSGKEIWKKAFKKND